jgi:ATP-dependent DNA helicase RecG
VNRKSITEQDAVLFTSRDEDHFFDRKALACGGKTVQKIAVALANADGGEFVISIADDEEEPVVDNRWHGAGKVEDFNPHLQALSEVKPTLAIEYSILDAPSRNGLVLLARVEKSAEVHQTADGTVYVRKGAQSLPIKDQQRILDLQFAKGAVSFEDQLLRGTPTEEVSDGPELQRFLSEYSPKSDPLEFATKSEFGGSKNLGAEGCRNIALQ